ncbi:amidohydrolase family protein [Zhouia amylolytica]|uniref:Putative TIM-barrel fold metal-dependent hydrolase n=1 Tax=Zhouia amylolytica AD3 TaxID=1286632 RepID=W2ULL1_9FLAO|nr:amidohydrolase family protein [Zhouia amylolytica]ETN94903.1 putative TIM-barrel fold metal-dependent hydrolase [Zhouia amylolytica AD3]
MLKQFIDAHVHLNTLSDAKMKLALERNVSFLSINTDIPFFQNLDEQEATVHALQKKYPDRILQITSFDTQYWNTDKWLPHALQQIKDGISRGAVGVKIWKNIGMDESVKDLDGNFVMLDDERFDPIYQYLIDNDILLIGHQGEPKNCWLPLNEMTVDSDRDYFSGHPEYHMYLHPEFPSYEKQMEARDNVLKKFPKLKYVGLHLFSMEWSIDEVAKRLDLYPNTKTDLAERICHVELQAKENWEKVRAFFIKYQDRIIYGTDVIDDGSMNDEELVGRFESLWQHHYDFFATNKTLSAPEFKGSFKGLELPEEVVYKIFVQNAVDTYGFNINKSTN